MAEHARSTLQESNDEKRRRSALEQGQRHARLTIARTTAPRPNRVAHVHTFSRRSHGRAVQSAFAHRPPDGDVSPAAAAQSDCVDLRGSAEPPRVKSGLAPLRPWRPRQTRCTNVPSCWWALDPERATTERPAPDGTPDPGTGTASGTCSEQKTCPPQPKSASQTTRQTNGPTGNRHTWPSLTVHSGSTPQASRTRQHKRAETTCERSWDSELENDHHQR